MLTNQNHLKTLFACSIGTIITQTVAGSTLPRRFYLWQCSGFNRCAATPCCQLRVSMVAGPLLHVIMRSYQIKQEAPDSKLNYGLYPSSCVVKLFQTEAMRDLCLIRSKAERRMWSGGLSVFALLYGTLESSCMKQQTWLRTPNEHHLLQFRSQSQMCFSTLRSQINVTVSRLQQ